MAYTNKSFQNSFMGDLIKSYFEYSGNIMSEHVGHENIGIVSVTWSESYRYIVNNVQIILEKSQSCIESIDLKLFLLLSSSFFKKGLINKLEMRSLHHMSNLSQIKFHLFSLHSIFSLNYY